MNLEIHMLVQLWNSFPPDLRSTKQKITEDVFVKKKIRNITMAERAENVYHVTGQNLHFAHAPYNKNKELKIVGNE